MSSERSRMAAPVVIGIALVPVMTVALALLTGGLGMWIVAVLSGGVLGVLVGLLGVIVLTSLHSIRRREVEQFVDPVTGLPSAERLAEDLTRVLADRREPRAVLSLHVLEGLKRYNDAYGRACGDALLSWLARKLSDHVGTRAVVYRLRGGEFAVLAHGDEDATAQVSRTATAALRVTGEGFVVCAAVGEAELPAEVRTVSEALKLIDHRAHAHLQALKGHAAPQPPPEVIESTRLRAPQLDVARLAVAVGHELELPVSGLDDLAAAASLRDVGNMAIPGAVLSRADSLTPEEWRFVALHTLVGERLLTTNFEMEEVGRLVRSSHERWDGQGYPDGLKGNEIPLPSRIVFACSAFEDMTSKRPHREALSTDAALAELDDGAGTQFDPEVVQALRSALAKHASEPWRVRATGPRRPMSVLVADDDPASRFLLARAIEASGHRCATAEDGDQAWQLFQDERPDVVISDARLPGIDGNELCRRVRAKGADTYFVMISAIGDLGRFRRGIGASADDFLTKPIVRDELELRLSAARRASDLQPRVRKRAAG